MYIHIFKNYPSEHEEGLFYSHDITKIHTHSLQDWLI